MKQCLDASPDLAPAASAAATVSRSTAGPTRSSGTGLAHTASSPASFCERLFTSHHMCISHNLAADALLVSGCIPSPCLEYWWCKRGHDQRQWPPAAPAHWLRGARRHPPPELRTCGWQRRPCPRRPTPPPYRPCQRSQCIALHPNHKFLHGMHCCHLALQDVFTLLDTRSGMLLAMHCSCCNLHCAQKFAYHLARRRPD